MHRSWKLAFIASVALNLVAGCGDNSSAGPSQAVGSGLVSGGVHATSTHFKLAGGVGQDSGPAKSHSFTAQGANP